MLKNQKGSITLFVLVAMLFFITILIVNYVNLSNKINQQNKEIQEIQEAYDETGKLEQIYYELADDMPVRVTLYKLSGEIYDTNEWTNENIRLEISYPEGTAEDYKYYYIDGVKTKYEENQIITKNCEIKVEYEQYKVNLTVSKIDKELPTVTLNPNGGAVYTMPTTGAATIKTTLTAEDAGGSGVDILQYAWSTSNTIEPTDWTTFKNGDTVSKTDITTAGTYYLWTNVMDRAGNCATTTKVSNAFIISDNTVEANKIILSANPTSWTNGTVTVTVSYGANLTQNKTLVGSGTEGIDYAVNGTTSVGVKTNEQTVTATATDIAGNEIMQTITIYNIDKILPTVQNISFSKENDTEEVCIIPGNTATISAELADGESGIKGYYISMDSTEPTEANEWMLEDGAKNISSEITQPGTYYIWAIDNANNISEAGTITIQECVATATVNGITTEHSTVQAAFDKCGTTSGSVVTLIKDGIREEATINSEQDITLELNGKTWNEPEGEEVAYIISNYGNLLVQDSVGNGNITKIADAESIMGDGAIGNYETANFTIKSGKISSASNGIVNVNTTGETYITGGTIESLNYDAFTILADSAGKIIITGGTFEAYESAFVAQGNSEITLSDDVYMVATNLEGISTCIIKGNSIVTVTGGKYESASSGAIVFYENATGLITGGDFSCLELDNSYAVIVRDYSTVTYEGTATTTGLYVADNSKLIMSGGIAESKSESTAAVKVIDNAQASITGGNISAESYWAIVSNTSETVEISGGQISGNYGTTIRYSVLNNGTGTMEIKTDANIPGLYNQAGTVHVYGGTITSREGSSRAITNLGTLIIDDGMIKGDNGANSVINNSTGGIATLNGGTYIVGANCTSVIINNSEESSSLYVYGGDYSREGNTIALIAITQR